MVTVSGVQDVSDGSAYTLVTINSNNITDKVTNFAIFRKSGDGRSREEDWRRVSYILNIDNKVLNSNIPTVCTSINPSILKAK